MAEKIDYKAYLAQLGKVETSQVERIKKYLDEQILEDEALKALYLPEKIDDCYNFIMNAVREMPRKGNGICVEDGIVYKMARDYFIEILPKVAEEAPEVKAAGAETAEEAEAEPENEKPAESVMLNQEEGGEKSVEEDALPDKSATMDNTVPKADDKGTVTDEYGFEVFGEEPESISEEGAETAEEAETEAETEPEAEPEDTSAEADNENLGTPCEDAEPENEKPESSEIKYDEEGNGLLFGF